jgi:CAI-1 autoinducer synthase
MPVELRPYLMCHSYPSIFSSCLLPHEVAGLAATLDVVKRGDEARQRLHANTRRVRAAFKEAGYPIDHGTEQIISLEAGTESDTLALRDALESRGVFGAVFCAPATSRNRAMVRLTLNAALTDAEMAHVAAVAKELAPHVKPWDWPIAKRQASRAA